MVILIPVNQIFYLNHWC